jgi:hypothetical protein
MAEGTGLVVPRTRGAGQVDLVGSKDNRGW